MSGLKDMITRNRGEKDSTQDPDIILHEENLLVEKEEVDAGSLYIQKRVETQNVEEAVSTGTEYAETERVEVLEGDSGEIETLEDGSVSIPIFAEELVITKRLVVKERIVVRKRTLEKDHIVSAQLKKERVDIETDGAVVKSA